MIQLPKAARPLASAFSIAFTAPTFQRVVVLFFGAILSLRQRTVTGMLRAAGPLAEGHWSDFHRVLCRRVWSCWTLGKVLAAMVLELVPVDEPAVCPVDDTASQHKGKRVYGKGRHHDACRSTHKYMVWVWGRKWIVLAANVKFPFARRPRALPVLCALYRPAELDQSEGRRHKTPIDLARQLAAVMIHWFPERKFILLGDGGYASHELARFCRRHRRHVTLVSRFHPQANLHAAPTNRAGAKGRPRVKGQKLPKSAEAVKASKAKRFTVDWCGGKTRRIELVWGEGNGYKTGDGLVPVRWVFVRDVEGTRRDECFYSTDPAMVPKMIVAAYVERWSVEATFQEGRAHLGWTTPRNWCRTSVLRTAPCLLGLFSVVSLIFHRHNRSRVTRPASTLWRVKAEPTFADALTRIRRLCWAEVFRQSPKHRGLTKLPKRLEATLLDQLSRAAWRSKRAKVELKRSRGTSFDDGPGSKYKSISRRLHLIHRPPHRRRDSQSAKH